VPSDGEVVEIRRRWLGDVENGRSLSRVLPITVLDHKGVKKRSSLE
jgi:hypothetical protein